MNMRFPLSMIKRVSFQFWTDLSGAGGHVTINTLFDCLERVGNESGALYLQFLGSYLLGLRHLLGLLFYIASTLKEIGACVIIYDGLLQDYDISFICPSLLLLGNRSIAYEAELKNVIICTFFRQGKMIHGQEEK